MATLKKKTTSILDQLQSAQEYYRSHYRPIKKRWSVNEFTPAWEDNDGYYHGSKTQRVSDYFESIEGAQDFIEAYDPARDSQFVIHVETLCEHTEQTWMAGDYWK